MLSNNLNYSRKITARNSRPIISGGILIFILLILLSLFGCTSSLDIDNVEPFSSLPAHVTPIEDSLCLASAPSAPRLETTLKIDLTQADGIAAFLEFLIVPANEKIGLANGQTRFAKNLKVGDLVTMISGRIGRIQSAKTQMYFPENTFVNKEGKDLRRVLGKSKRWTNTIFKLHTTSEIIETTPEHPFYVNNQWIEAQFLKPGDTIASLRKTPVSLIKTETVTPENGGTFVYNLKVESLENFYVGNSGLLAHNCVDGTCEDCYANRKLRDLDPPVRHNFESHDLITFPGNTEAILLFKTAQKAIHNGKQNTLLLSGTHGTPEGYTAIDYPVLSSGRFFLQDIDTMIGLYTFEPYKSFTIADLPVMKLSNAEVNESFFNGSFRGKQYDCVIAAFCFSEVRYNRAQQYSLNRVGGTSFD